MKFARPLLILVALYLAGCSTSPSPVLPPVTLTPVENAFHIKRLWQTDLGEGAGENYLKLAPVLDNGVLYVTDHEGQVTAYNVKDSSVRWQVKLSVPVATALTLNDDLLFLGSSHGDVFALHEKDGSVAWHAEVSSEVLAPPKVAKDLVIVRCVNGMLYALKRDDGKQVWSLEQTTPALSLRGTSAPVIAGDIVLSGFDNGRLLAINLESGKLLWTTAISIPRGRTDLERMVDIDATPVVVDDMVYTVSYQGRIAAVQLGSGRIMWSRDIDSYSGMAVDAYRIYLVDSQSRVWALDRFNGATIWKQDDLLRRSLTTPRLQDQYVVVADFDGFVHWLRRDNGKIVARLRLNTYDYTNPDLDETGDLLFPKLNNVLAAPLVDDRTVIVMGRYGHTEAFDVHYP
ncbi:MAG: outer membrane protein assembly factor BamB [Gammaproteobacteria bacterium]|nr:outer membrane protein assembly factor BamB [Gammaproteobacteria bacterium]